jgi:hypothetical protein
MMVTEASVLRHRMLRAPLALEGAVTNAREGHILRGWQGLQGVADKPPQPDLRPPRGRAEQTPAVLISQMGRAMTAQLLQVCPIVIDAMPLQ